MSDYLESCPDPGAAGERVLLEKAALSCILLQPAYEHEFAEIDWLSAAQKESIMMRAETERKELSEIYTATQQVVRSSTLTDIAKKEAIEKCGYNDRAHEIMAGSMLHVDMLMDGGVQDFTEWLYIRWEEDRLKARCLSNHVNNRAGGLTYTVFGTQYFGETDYEVAIPDKYIKFANRDWSHYSGYEDNDYSLKLERAGYTVSSVLVWDVGPWNIDDNYWNPASGHPRPRRLFTDLDQGMPEAQAAYYDGYNDGKDQYGRIVTVPTAVDMTPDLAADLGLAYLQNDWITVTFLWEDEESEEMIVDDSDGKCRFIGPPANWVEVSGYGTNNQMHYTYNITSGWKNAALWKFRLPYDATCNVSVFIPSNHATTKSANYYINTGSGWNGPYTVNQSIYYDEWVSLGTHNFKEGRNRVAVIDGTGESEDTKKVGVDAAKITLVGN